MHAVVNKTVSVTIASMMLLLLITGSSSAQVRDWAAPFGSFNHPTNWAPIGVPGAIHDVRIGQLPIAENANVSFENDIVKIIARLEITDGARLQISDGRLEVISDIIVSGATELRPTQLYIQTSGDNSLRTENLTIADQGQLRMVNGPIVYVYDNMTILPDSTLIANGRIRLSANSGISLSNRGVIESESGHGGLILDQIGDGLIDLDGTGAGVVRVDSGNGFFGQDQLTVNGTELSDSFSGTIEMATASILTINLTDGWIADSNSVINIESRNSNADGITTIEGSHITLAGEMNLINTNGVGDDVDIVAPVTIEDTATIWLEEGNTLHFFEDVAIDGGTFTTHSNSYSDGAIVFHDPTTWSGNIDINGVAYVQGQTAYVPGLTVVNAGVFHMQGQGFETWNIAQNLTVNAESINVGANNDFDGVVNLVNAFSRLTVNLDDDAAAWTMNGTINVVNHLPGPATRMSGSPVILNGQTNIQDGPIRWTADATFADSSSTDFMTGEAQLLLTGKTVVETNASFFGGGTFVNELSGSLTLQDGASLNNLAMVNEGRFEVAESAGIADVNQFESTPGGNWIVQIGGYLAGSEFDLLQVGSGLATLDGNLCVQLIDLGNGLFTPSIGDEFTILSSVGGVAGQFDSQPVSLADGNAYQWEVLYNPNDVTLRLADVIPNVVLGDVNEDGAVNLLDVAPFVDLLNTGTYMLQADINCDGAVNLLDVDPFIELLNNGN